MHQVQILERVERGDDGHDSRQYGDDRNADRTMRARCRV